ncbi:restriction endonuclease [Aeromonas sp. A04]|uniref:restriction endonuclease n=1 Tax=Aeromonas sp. A04 TaxID=3398359 RepID=UPI0039F72C7F
MGQMKAYIDWHRIIYNKDPLDGDKESVEKFVAWRKKYSFNAAYWRSKDLDSPAIIKEFKLHSPSAQLILDIKNQKISLSSLTWREFEEMVDELLKKQGWNTTLGRGTKDGGIDIFAEKIDPAIGTIKTIWQAKHLSEGNKVSLKEIRELYGIVAEHRVTKGIIVTSTFLTRGAIERVEKDCCVLGKSERPEILDWIEKY